MGLIDRLFGSPPKEPQAKEPQQPKTAPEQETSIKDEQAVQRYRYLLRTAPPEAIEQAHAEAFAQLTPEQRAQVLRELSQQVPLSERAAVPSQADPQSLARLATRAELRQPGILERTLGPRSVGGGMGFGSMLAGSLLGSIAGTVIGSAIAHQFMGGFYGSPESLHHPMDSAQAQADDADSDDGDSSDSDDSDSDDSSDGGGDDYADDYGGDDFGGGDFGGGDLSDV